MSEQPANITDEEIQALEGVQSMDEWNTLCKDIQKRRDGAFPPDWWAKVKLSGLMDRVTARFGGSSELRIVSYHHR